MNLSYYSSRDAGHFINVINVQVNGTVDAFRSILLVGSQLVQAITYAVLAFAVAWRFGMSAILLGLAFIALFRWLNIYVRQLSRKASLEEGFLSQQLIQALHAFKYLASTAQISPLQRTIGQSLDRLMEYQIRTQIANSFTNSIREPLSVLIVMIIVLIQLVILDQPLSPILVSILLFYRGLNSSLGIQSAWQSTLGRAGCIEMVRDEFQLQEQQKEPDGHQPVGTFNHSIRLENIYFRHMPELDDILKEVSFELPACTSVAFVGKSGAGKSTLVDVLTLMQKPHIGQGFIDGVEGQKVELSTWRQQIGYVSQDTVVFDDTIANNITLWAATRQNNDSLMPRVFEAARQAHIAQFIESLPNGYDTMVGDRGMRLSGGQRQRLFIARELFRRPKLLILDEATSSLDTESERSIQRSIDGLKGLMTVIIIAHRLSTIRNVDNIYVLESGRIVEQGTYDELKERAGSRFGELLAIQAT